ncbi:MAG: peptidase S41, partial [Oscillospiraceae bacterium]
MNKKISLGTAIALMLIMIAATFSITMVYSAGIFSDKMHDIKEREAIYSKLSEIDNLVRTNYLNDIDKEKLMDSI